MFKERLAGITTDITPNRPKEKPSSKPSSLALAPESSIDQRPSWRTFQAPFCYIPTHVSEITRQTDMSELGGGGEGEEDGEGGSTYPVAFSNIPRA